jgi:hypothetical protein
MREPRNGSWPLEIDRKYRLANNIALMPGFTMLVTNAARPLGWRLGPLPALLLLVGRSPLRRRALTATRFASPSGAPYCRF